jgi:hypothetical protein
MWSASLFALWAAAPSAHAIDLCQPLTVQPGQPVEMQATGANPGETVVFLRGSGPGVTPAPNLAGSADLAGARVLRAIAADANGVATFSGVVPVTVPVGLRFGIQAAVVRGGRLVKSAPFFSVMRAANDPANDCASGRVCPNPDGDADLVHDVCDLCPGGDDRVDTDGDGQPDACQSTLVDLVAWWDFNTFEDRSGNGHDAWVQSGALVPGLIDGAYALNGAGDHCVVDPTPDFDLTEQITIAAWVYPDAVDSFRTIFSRGDSRGGRRGDWGLYVTDGQILVDMNYPAGEIQASSTGAVIVPGSWYHVAAVIDATAGYIDFYQDGGLVSRYTGPIVLPQSGLGGLIGTDVGTPHDWFGRIDDLRIWGRALDPFEVFDLSR